MTMSLANSVIQLLLFSIVIVIISWIGILFYIYYARLKYRHIPGPDNASFILGNIPQLREGHRRGINPHEQFYIWSRQYGPLFRLHLLHRTMIVVSGKEIVKEILTKKDYPKCDMIYGMLFNVCGQRFLGRGLVTNTDQNEWTVKHKHIAPAFKRFNLKGFMGQLDNCIDLWVNNLSLVADGQTLVNLAGRLDQLALDIIINFSCGSDQLPSEAESKKLFNCFELILEGMEEQHRDPLMKLRPSKWDFRKKVQAAARYVRDKGHEKVQEILGRKIQDERSILGLLVSSLENGTRAEIEDILDDYVTVFIAGQETTSNALAFIFHEIARHPKVLQRLINEVEGKIGNRSSLCYEDTLSLTYMTQVIKETLRLYPIVSATAREPQRDVVLHGYNVPKGTFLAVPFSVLHRQPEYYENPMEFNPDRFHPEAHRTLYAFTPFSLGQRSCLGKQFAMVTMKIVLIKFLQNFRYEVDPSYVFAVKEMSTFKPKGGCPMTLTHKA
ncbi:hypothetical protein CAPTEDRAFT_220705 [Capitella teleta]|uniref:Cytochrome P450 n=1 Tax=Capitella teleta TaxID=283909 RepID=R7UR91_CAPTE|nr:hypothetical protein CAPTEDRAFT_220705 [Capitella teleta]|eukprot:ELU08623.1 hypothetical protein CAPTEDRAFT_220705 [Capitella teleta]